MFKNKERIFDAKNLLLEEDKNIVKKIESNSDSSFTESIVNKLYASIRKKLDQLDIKEIDISKGKLLNLPNYEYVAGAIEWLEKIYNQADMNNKTALEYLSIIKISAHNIIKYEKEFNFAYINNKELIKIIYSGLVLNLLLAVNMLIAFSIEYIKQPDNSYLIRFREINKKNFNLLESSADQLNKFNGLCESGEIKKLFVKILEEQLVMDFDLKTKTVSLNEGVFAMIVGVIAALYLLFKIIKFAIYSYYYIKDKVANYLEHTAEFVKLNALRLEKQSPDVAKKQMEMAKNLERYAMEMKTNEEAVNYQVNQDINSENKELYKDNSEIKQYNNKSVIF